ncbi:MAG TPA: hypothetical protein DCZ01_00670 [Elusimicrobia bacterium]|nr:MAG: hypothetical protein A2X37_04085 [Elusimicrobia bacterium GWA2_66_18]OGR68999.1 MAG: hypothetical protein A2X40_10670 [Elusimicrobia bacterium GWC2_65_9]HAZ07045.1 hypothetical protein [Elusimicrobiota bacterium]
MASAQILCTQCGAATVETRAMCSTCGGLNTKVCGACGNQNSLSKNFCDKCGGPISELGPVAPPPKTVPPGSPTADIPVTAVRRGPPPGPGPRSSAPVEPGSISGLDDLWAVPTPLPVIDNAVQRPRFTLQLRHVINTLAALAGISGAFFGIEYWREHQRPEIMARKRASEYLDALRAHDYARAYGMFSELTRKNCTEAEFRASRDEIPWTWSNLRIVHQEPYAILLAYDLQAQEAPSRTDHLLFTLEGKNWVRPYNLTLLRKVEESFNRNDADQGFHLAHVATAINPRDPMAWGYLCEAAYRKTATSAEMRCLRAIELAHVYPSTLTLKSLYHLHAILADIYHHSLNKPQQALEQFAQMLSFPDISPADQCQILLARSQSYTALSRPGESLADLERASQLCTQPNDLSSIQRMRESMHAPDP